jgi:hypothetical protein
MLTLRAATIVALTCVLAPLGADAQQTSRVYRIGWLSGYSLDEPFRQGLRALGYVEGQNLVIETRFTLGNVGRYLRHFGAVAIRGRPRLIPRDL